MERPRCANAYSVANPAGGAYAHRLPDHDRRVGSPRRAPRAAGRAAPASRRVGTRLTYLRLQQERGGCKFVRRRIEWRSHEGHGNPPETRCRHLGPDAGQRRDLSAAKNLDNEPGSEPRPEVTGRGGDWLW